MQNRDRRERAASPFRSSRSGLLAAGLTLLLATVALGEDRVEQILSRMTLEEKAGQMTQITLEAVSSERGWVDTTHELDVDALRAAIVEKHVGSILNQFDVAFTQKEWRSLVGQVQSIAMQDTRLKIPVIYGVDSVHGANYLRGGTIFPQNLTLAATWNPSLAYDAGVITARETRACGIPWNFAPVADVGRQPLWSRFFETFGEDPLLVGVMAAATVQGLQAGDDLTRVAACGKHFLGYSVPRSGKDRTPAAIGSVELFDTFVPPFEAMIKAGVPTMMVNSGEINGVPVHVSHDLLTGLLRERLGFDGVVVTDWADIEKLHETHKVAPTLKDATRQAVLAGIDMSMVPMDTQFADDVVALVQEGALTEERIDASVRRILRLKESLGLFDAESLPVPTKQRIATTDALASSLAAAREGLVLLRNRDDVLPLRKAARLLVTGPTADALPPVYGAWSYTWQGDQPELYPKTPTVLKALRKRFGAGRVQYVPGSTYDSVIDLAPIRGAARSVDAIVLCLGEAPSTEKPGDIADLALEPAQIELARAAIETGKPVILLLLENRPRLFHEVEAELDAVVWAGQPGPFGPQAFAELIAGDFNPSGRLPFTYPNRSGDLITYDRKSTEDVYRPLFEFGSGLSYTPWWYSNLRVDLAGETLRVSVDLANKGDRAGQEVVQLYVTDEYASVTPHAQRLKAFEKRSLDAGERTTVVFELSKDDLSLINRAGERVFEPGGFGLRIGELQSRIDWE